VGRPEAKRSLVGSSRRLEDDIKMDLKKWDGEPWTGLIWFSIGTGCGRL
jgi:hypothetical protein